MVSTTASGPVSPALRDYLSSGRVRSTLTIIDTSFSVNTWIYGTIQSVTSTLSITTIMSTENLTVTRTNATILIDLVPAFGDLSAKNITITGQGASTIDPNNIILPNGMYTICVFAANENDCVPNGDPSASCLLSALNSGCPTFTVNCNPLNAAFVNTVVTPPANSLINQFILNNGVSSSIQFNAPPGCDNATVKVLGKIDRISPTPFTIIPNSDYIPMQSLPLFPGSTQPITPGLQLEAFANFDENKLSISGVDPSTLRDANGQLKLPDGNYRICYYAKYFDSSTLTLDGDASNPNLGCGTFTICGQAGGAPQFTQPINSLNINSAIPLVRPASPVVFTWLAPQSTCGLPPGGFKYDLEIWELMNDQNVTDAVNNPFVFRKTDLPSPTFLLDTNLNRNVLQEGKRYAIRVRAVGANTASPIEIENDGYSRIEAFQYGNNLPTDIEGRVIDPHDYYIPFTERKTKFWENVYHSGSDTLVPINEYIAFALTHNATAYSLDAIDLFLSLNPQLTEVKQVKLNFDPQLPVFPEISENDRLNFDKEQRANLEPYNFENNKFLKYLDTLNDVILKIPPKAVELISDLKAHLNNIKPEIDSVDQVTVNYINMVLAELVYELRHATTMNNSQYTQLQGLVSTLMDLTTDSQQSTAVITPIRPRNNSSLSAYDPKERELTTKLALKYPSFRQERAESNRLLATISKQLLPFDIIVWRKMKEPPYKPILDAPDLAASYRIFYTLSKLYNHKNPAVNAKSSGRLASTIQLSLPSNSVFKFWTLNMTSHKMTNAEDVDLMNVLEHTKTVAPGAKKPSIVIKVD